MNNFKKRRKDLNKLLEQRSKAFKGVNIHTQPELYSECVKNYNIVADEINAFVRASASATKYETTPLDKASILNIAARTMVEWSCTPVEGNKFVIESRLKPYSISVESVLLMYEEAKKKWERETKSAFPFITQ